MKHFCKVLRSNRHAASSEFLQHSSWNIALITGSLLRPSSINAAHLALPASAVLYSWVSLRKRWCKALWVCLHVCLLAQLVLRWQRVPLWPSLNQQSSQGTLGANPRGFPHSCLKLEEARTFTHTRPENQLVSRTLMWFCIQSTTQTDQFSLPVILKSKPANRALELH